MVEHAQQPPWIERRRPVGRTPAIDRIVAQTMCRERDLQSVHEQRVSRLTRTIEQMPKRRADMEEHPIGQTLSVGTLDRGRIDVGIRQRARVEERRWEVEMKTLIRSESSR